jgi:hypothetical protein
MRTDHRASGDFVLAFCRREPMQDAWSHRPDALSGIRRTSSPDGHGLAILWLWSVSTTFVVIRTMLNLRSRARQRLLAYYFANPTARLHLRDLAGRLEYRPGQPVEGAPAPRDGRVVSFGSQRTPEVFSAEPRISVIFRTPQHRLKNHRCSVLDRPIAAGDGGNRGSLLIRLVRQQAAACRQRHRCARDRSSVGRSAGRSDAQNRAPTRTRSELYGSDAKRAERPPRSKGCLP